MALYPGSTIRIRLFFLVILAVVPLFGLTLYTAARERQYDIDHVQEEALKLAKLIASVQQRQVEISRQFLVTLAGTVEATNPQPETYNGLFSKLTHELPIYSNFLLADKSGEVRGSGAPLSSPRSVAHEPWFQQAIRKGEFTVGGRSADDAGNESSMVLCAPVLSKSGTVDGIVCASLDLDRWLNQALSRLPIPPDTAVTILNGHGAILGRFPEAEKWIGRNVPDCPAVQNVLSLREGVADTIDVDGVGGLVRLAVEKARKVRPNIKLGICGEHGGDPASIHFCHEVGLNYVSCSPFRVPIARLAAAQAAITG